MLLCLSPCLYTPAPWAMGRWPGLRVMAELLPICFTVHTSVPRLTECSRAVPTQPTPEQHPSPPLPSLAVTQGPATGRRQQSHGYLLPTYSRDERALSTEEPAGGDGEALLSLPFLRWPQTLYWAGWELFVSGEQKPVWM